MTEAKKKLGIDCSLIYKWTVTCLPDRERKAKITCALRELVWVTSFDWIDDWSFFITFHRTTTIEELLRTNSVLIAAVGGGW